MSKVVVACIPSYNAETTILKTLESLVSQNYPISKIKVFDNKSIDKTTDIVREFSRKYDFVELHENEENLGGEGNFTRCIQAAEGDYCIVAHSDDIYEKDFLSNAIDVLDKNPECVAAFCGAWEINEDGKKIGIRLHPTELSSRPVSVISKSNLLSLSFKYGNFITCPSVLVRSKVYKEDIRSWNGGKFKTSADLDVWLRLSQVGDLVAIEKPLMQYRVAEVSHSFRLAKKRITRHDLFLVLDYYRQIYANILTNADEENYRFLNLKDQAIRSLNMFRNKIKNEPFPKDYSFDLNLISKRIFLSKWHFKMGLSIIGIYLLTKALELFGWGKPCKK